MRSLIFAASLVVALLLAYGIQAQEATGTVVNLSVTDPSGAAIPHAEILMRVGSGVEVTGADEHGHFSFNLPSGRDCTMTVWATWYKRVTVQIDFRPGGAGSATKDVTVVLKPDDAHPKGSLSLTADSYHAPVTLSLVEFRALPHVNIKVHNAHADADETYSGVPLAALLAKVNAPLGENLRGKAPANYVVASGFDGYSVVVSLAELDPSFHDGQILVADACDGQPLADSGPFRLIVSEDKRPARWVWNLVSISVQSIH